MALRWLATGAAALAMAAATAVTALAEEARIAPLGFTAADVTPALAKKYDLFLKDMLRGGVVVTAAREGASVRVGDHLLKAGGRSIVSAPLLAERAAKLQPGEALALAGLRGAERIAIKAAAPNAEPARAPRKLIAAPLLSLATGGHTAAVRDVIIRGDLLFTASDDKTVRIWSLSKKKLLRVLRGPSGPGNPGKIQAMALSPDGKILALGGFLFGPLSERHAIRLVDLASGATLALLRGHDDVVIDLAFSPDGRRLVSGSADRTALIWDVAGIRRGERRKPLVRLTGHKAPIYGVRFSPDGERVVTASFDRTLRLWRAGTGERIRVMEGHRDRVRTLAIAPDGTIASGDRSGEIRLWDGRTGAPLRRLADQGGYVGALAFSPDGKALLATCAAPGCGLVQRIYELATGAVRRRFTDHENIVLAGAWISPERLVTAGGADQEIQIWSRKTAKSVAKLRGVGRVIWSTGFSPDSKRVAWGLAGTSRPQLARHPLEFSLSLAGPDSKAAPGVSDRPQKLQGRAGWKRAILATGSVRLAHIKGGPFGFADGVLIIDRAGKLPVGIVRDASNGLLHSAYSLSPDGKIVISGGAGGQLTAYDLSGKELGAYVGHTSDVWAVTPSPDGRLLATAGADQTIRLWNLKTRELIVTLFPMADGAFVIWTPQGYYDYVVPPGHRGVPPGRRIGWLLNYGADKTADFVTAEQLGPMLRRPKLIARAIALASAKAAVKEAIEAQATAIAVLEGHTGWVQGAKILADGRILSWSKDGTLRLWSAKGAQIAVLKGHTDSVWGAKILADGRILSWSEDGDLRLWSAKGAEIAVLKGHAGGVKGVKILADGRILSWSSDSSLRLWSAKGAEITVLKGHTDDVWGAEILADGRILSWSEDGSLRLWSAKGAQITVLKGHTDDVWGAEILADGRILSWSGDNTLRLWSAKGAQIAMLKGHTGWVQGAKILADGRILSWSYDGSLRLWSAKGAQIAVLKGHTSGVWGATILADGRILSWSFDKTLRLWSAKGAEIAVLKGHRDGVLGAKILADGRILSWSFDKTLRLWSAKGAEIAVLEGHRGDVLGAEILADGRILSWSNDDTLRIWPRSLTEPYKWAGEVIARLKPLSVAQQCAAFQLSEKVCRLVGGDVIAIDAVEALLRLGREQLAKRDAAAAERAFAAALELPGERRYDRLQQLYYPDQDISAATAAARRAKIERRIAEIRKGGG